MPERTDRILAVDFGSSNTVAVLRRLDEPPRTLLFDGSPLLPSAVFGTVDGALIVGRDAAHMSRDEPARFEPYPKRRIDEGTVLLGDREVPVVDLVAAVLRRVADEARRVAGVLPPVVLTHPVAWGQARREVLTAAAAAAGLQVAGMVAEPIAAAGYFTSVLGSELGTGRALAVFDFGGGTLDIAVVRRTGAGLEVVATGGLNTVGGVDLDAAIISHVGVQVQRQAPHEWARLAQPHGPADLRDRGLVWQDAQHAKEMLSRSANAALHVPGLPSGTHLTRAEFERLATPLLARAVAETAATVRRAGMRPADLAGVFLVGGSSRIPLAGQLLHRELGVAPTVLEQPETAVAEGALHTGAAPRIPPHLARALDGLSRPAVAPQPGPEPHVPAPRRRRWVPPLVAVGAAAVVAAVVLVLLQPWQSGTGGNRAGERHSAGTGSTPGKQSAGAGDQAATGGSSADRCPTNDEVQQATERDKNVADDMTVAVQGNPTCADGWAYTKLLAARAGGAQQSVAAILHVVNGRWEDVVLDAVCAPDSDGSKPDWATRAPAKIFHAAGCQDQDYTS